VNIPDFTTIRHEGRTLKQLAKVDAHNRRLMETPNARSDVPADPTRYVLKGGTLIEAVQAIIAEAGAAGLASIKWTPIQAALMSFSFCLFSKATGEI
jgi:hypothetical protein